MFNKRVEGVYLGRAWRRLGGPLGTGPRWRRSRPPEVLHVRHGKVRGPKACVSAM